MLFLQALFSACDSIYRLVINQERHVLQDANTLVRNLREFMQHQLLLQHWEDLKREVMAPGSSLQKVQDAHDKYLRAAATSCFLDSSNVYRRLRTVSAHLRLHNDKIAKGFVCAFDIAFGQRKANTFGFCYETKCVK